MIKLAEFYRVTNPRIVQTGGPTGVFWGSSEFPLGFKGWLCHVVFTSATLEKKSAYLVWSLLHNIHSLPRNITAFQESTCIMQILEELVQIRGLRLLLMHYGKGIRAIYAACA